jgi:hypothetical protein
METSGESGSFLDLLTDFDFLNNLRDGKFGIVSVFEVDSDTANFRKIFSTETSSGQGLPLRKSSPETYTSVYDGTDPFDVGAITITEDNIHSFVQIANLTTGDGWVLLDGNSMGSDASISGLVASQSTLMRLASNAYSEGAFAKAKFGFTAILDFTAVTDTIDATWSTDLSEAINNAAVSSNYNAHSIAAAIFAYDNNISGVYYALNELSSGDASDCYLLAYDIATQTAITQGFYGLTSTSGVTGTRLVLGGRSTYGPERSTYGNPRSTYGVKRSTYGILRSTFSN